MTFFEKSVVRRGQPCGQYALRKVPLVEIEVIATLREDSNAENRGQKAMNWGLAGLSNATLIEYTVTAATAATTTMAKRFLPAAHKVCQVFGSLGNLPRIISERFHRRAGNLSLSPNIINGRRPRTD